MLLFLYHFLIALITLIVLLFISFYIRYKQNTKLLEHIPGIQQFIAPQIAGLLPSFLVPKETITIFESIVTMDGIKYYNEKYGSNDIFKMVFGVLNIPFVVITNPELGKEISTKGAKVFVKNRRFLASLNELFEAPNLFSEWDANEHYRIRHLVEPAFSPDSLGVVASSTNDTCIKDMIPLMKKNNLRRDVMNDFANLTLDVIGKAGFGYSFNSFKELLTKEEVEGSLSYKTQQVFKYFLVYGFLPSTWLRKKVNIGFYGILHDAADTFKKNIKEIIESRESEISKSTEEIESNDILSLLLKARRKSKEEDKKSTLSDAELIANAFVLIVAGHETTARTLGFCCYLLAINPHIMQKLQNFVDEFVQINQKDTFDYEDFKNGKLEYIRAVFKETLRLYPVAPCIVRELAKSIQWKGQTIPKGATCIYAWVLSHKDPKYWEDPEEFKPERFLDDNGRVYNPVKNPFVYSPFGVGNRICIGKSFAEVEAIIALAQIARNFNLKLSNSNYKMKPLVSLTLYPEETLLIDFEQRK
ncbi:hypothetical protein ABK040_012293 [Willaertia magna]